MKQITPKTQLINLHTSWIREQINLFSHILFHHANHTMCLSHLLDGLEYHFLSSVVCLCGLIVEAYGFWRDYTPNLHQSQIKG